MWQIAELERGSRRSMSPEDFQSRFLSICSAHRTQGRALAFAFVVFDTRHPEYRRAMNEDVYWEALDALSGRDLSVFSFDIPGVSPRRSSSSSTVIRMLTSVPSRGDLEPVDALSRYFKGLSFPRLPCVLFFQVEGGAVVGSFAVGLDASAKSMDAAYQELSDTIRTAVESIESVQDENAANSREVFQLIVEGLQERSVKRGILRVYQAVKGTATIAGIGKLISELM
jgi:hypothetical protein